MARGPLLATPIIAVSLLLLAALQSVLHAAWVHPAPRLSLVTRLAAASDKAAEEKDVMKKLAETEDADELAAMNMAASGEVSNRIAIEAMIGDGVQSSEAVAQEIENEYNAQQEAFIKNYEAEQRNEVETIPSALVVDFETLVEKYGGAEKVYKDHEVAYEKGWFPALPAFKRYLDEIGYLKDTGRKSYYEFEHRRGGVTSRLVLIGTNHISRSSSEFVREVMQREKPECVIVEQCMGNDSLQRFTIPDALFQSLKMDKAPSVLTTVDDEIDRVRKFQNDRVWLEDTPILGDIGAASFGHEFSVALEEFAKQRLAKKAGGPRGGTVCFADTDLRTISPKGMLPGLDELGKGAALPLRDLQMAQAFRVALRNHKSVVGVVGKDHMLGMARLLLQDPNIVKVKEGGAPYREPTWFKELEQRGKRWEQEFVGGSKLLAQLSKATEESPYGTWMSASGINRLFRYREETAALLKESGPDVELPAPLSSELAQMLFGNLEAYSPEDEADLRAWLQGDEVDLQEAGNFPYEMQKRKKPQSVPAEE